MKTYNSVWALMALFIIGCNTDEVSDTDEKPDVNLLSNYTVLVNTNGMLSGKRINIEAETFSTTDELSGFSNIGTPQLISEEGKILAMYHQLADCSGSVTIHDFSESTSKSIDVFTDVDKCDITAKAIVNGSNSVYVAFEKTSNVETKEYFIRSLDIAKTGTAFVDVQLEFKPEGLAFANNKVFILGLDEEGQGEHKMTVLDAKTNTRIFEENLGYDAQNIFKNPKGDIIVGFNELHITYNSISLTSSNTNYPLGKEPNFVNSELKHYDSSGKMYYAALSGTHSLYSQIPAVYNFSTNLAVLYAYENFLTEAQLNFEFKIENTTVVHYDEANNLLLVGYKKLGEGDKGGLLRIKPIPDPKLIGNLDTDGIPYAIYID